MELKSIADKTAYENEMPWSRRVKSKTMYQFIKATADKFPNRNAISFQITSGPKDKAETMTWAETMAKTIQAANVFRRLGVGESDVVAYMLPNCNEAAISLLGGAVAGIVNPINPLLEPSQIGAILRETNAKVLVTLRAFPKTDVAEKAAEAVALAPNVKTILEVDLLRYLTPPKSWIVPLIRPKVAATHGATVMNFNDEMSKARGDALDFEDGGKDRIAAYFHTGGTTGMPKVAQHKYSGMIYNGFMTAQMALTEKDILMCPLPLFHVFAAYPVLMAAVAAGAHVVLPTPQGYRGDGVFDNFWKLIERWQATFMITVPTAAAALMQRPVDADISSISKALSGSAPLPVELFKKFEDAVGVNIIEGYGMTEATCITTVNPLNGERKIGSVGLPMPYTHVRILDCDANGKILKELGTDEVGEICIASPGVFAGKTYTEAAKNKGLFADKKYLRTGDLGRIDADGYVYITGRAKDLIIRGGHNIDPAAIEEALMGHPDVAFVGAIGQPDAHAGEVPAAYVELIAGGNVDVGGLMAYAQEHVTERAAHPKHVEILVELPKTAVGKVFKPDLRKSAITRVFNGALTEAGIAAQVTSVIDDKKLGLVAQIAKSDQGISDEVVNGCLGDFTVKWAWAA